MGQGTKVLCLFLFGRVVWMGVLNYYELLDISYDATYDTIRAAYKDKIVKSNGLLDENYKTAYYVLSNPVRRRKYDLRIGIHKYRKVGRIYKIMKALARMVLTVLDAFFSFFWCFLLVVVCFVFVCVYVQNAAALDALNFSFEWIKTYAGRLFDFILAYKLRVGIMVIIMIADLVLHSRIRRTNRMLKHFKWEV